VSNGTASLLIAILTMILPNEKPWLSQFFLIKTFFLNENIFLFIKDWKYNPIVTWTDLSKNYPWGTLTLIGAGLSIAQAFQVYQKSLFSIVFFYLSCKVSKLSNLLADALHFVHDSSHLVILVTIIILSEVCTQMINNLSIGTLHIYSTNSSENNLYYF
jgi:hypothetical protein